MYSGALTFSWQAFSPITCPTCSEAHVHKVIEDDRHLAVTEGVQHHFPLQMLISGVSGVDGHSSVSQHSFDTGCCYDDLLICRRQRETNEYFRVCRDVSRGFIFLQQAHLPDPSTL